MKTMKSLSMILIATSIFNTEMSMAQNNLADLQAFGAAIKDPHNPQPPPKKPNHGGLFNDADANNRFRYDKPLKPGKKRPSVPNHRRKTICDQNQEKESCGKQTK